MALEMEVDSLAETMTNLSTKSKGVSFAPFVSQITFPPDVDAPSVETMWYGKTETQKLAKEDVDTLTAQERSRAKVAGSIASGVNKTMVLQEEESGVCPRGLEMYMPGHFVPYQSRRRSYRDALLRKQELLTTLHGKGSEEMASHLQKFLVLRSKACREEAHALGLQDALDAQRIHRAGTAATPPSEHLASSAGTSQLAKQALTTMRHPQATMLRAV